MNGFITANKYGFTQTTLLESLRRADNRRFLAFGKDNCFRIFLNRGCDALQERSFRILTTGKRLFISLHILNRFSGLARIHRRLGHIGRNFRDKTRIKWRGNNIVFAIFRALPMIGCRDFFGNVLASKVSESVSTGQLHFFIDVTCTHI